MNTNKYYWITNEIYNRSVKDSLLDIFLACGYRHGHCKCAKLPIKKQYYNNGNIMIVVYDDETIPENFIKGRLPLSKDTKNKISKANKNCIPWNKGTNFTVCADTRAKINKALATDAVREKKHISMLGKNKGKIMSEIARKKLSIALTGRKRSQSSINKQFNTKKINGTSNTSKAEDTYYLYLTKLYGLENVERQYKDKRYPFACDFYIKNLDLFIELNLTWCHGGQEFIDTDEKCLAKLKIWQQKAATSAYYKHAIEVWTIKDKQKIATANANNLNYKIYYSEKELYKND